MMAATQHRESGGTASRRWARRIAIAVAALALVLVAAYAVRCTLLLHVARIFLDRDAELVAQERADGVTIVFATPPPPWVAPMKNVMNPMWQPIAATGVNYYTFAGPGHLFRSYSERSDPESPYYQAWVGAYVTRKVDGTLPEDMTAWAKQVTELDQRSWLAAMGDPHPLAESATPANEGTVVVDGRTLTLWHGAMRSHSDISAKPDGPLATLIGMPARSSWPPGIESFQDVTLDGYFVCWPDAKRGVSIVVYGVAAIADDRLPPGRERRRDIRSEVLSLMKTARLEAVR